MKNAKAYPGVDINSDHNLVVGVVQIKLKRMYKGKTKDTFDPHKLKEKGNTLKLEEMF